MKKYTVELKESEFFIILNSLFKERNKEVGKTKKYDKLCEIINKFDKEYFN